jgi:hypothetical protein
MDTFVGWAAQQHVQQMPVPLQKLVTHDVMPLVPP